VISLGSDPSVKWKLASSEVWTCPALLISSRVVRLSRRLRRYPAFGRNDGTTERRHDALSRRPTKLTKDTKAGGISTADPLAGTPALRAGVGAKRGPASG